MEKDKYYVVLVGHRPGIYISWDDARVEVEGYSGARHRAFRNWKEVMACWDEHFSKACAPSRPYTASYAVQVAAFSDDLYIRHSSSHSSRQTMPTSQESTVMVSRAVSTDDLPPSP
ncbi:ribonuclease H-like [Magnolia sinica]|uniref:ribonuclease H-like n=1 Tax=Magnolia sinica TaxID=86752 RepID=UPI0026583CCC|nr:ribonuclease H-like [Magnolia sinica]